MSIPCQKRLVLQWSAVLATSMSLVACGGNSSPPAMTATSSGFAVDGYLKQATVVCDSNRDGMASDGEMTTQTDSTGAFVFSPACAEQLLAYGGVNLDTNLPFDGRIKSPAGAKIISPLTTLMAEGMSKERLLEALALPADTDVLNTDPAYAPAGDLRNPELMKKTAAVQLLMQKTSEIMLSLAASSDAAEKQMAYGEVVKSMATALQGGLNLIDANGMVEASTTSMVKTAAQGMGSDASAVSDIVREAVKGVNADTLASVVGGALKMQSDMLLDSEGKRASTLSDLSKTGQADTTVADFVKGKKDDLAGMPDPVLVNTMTTELNDMVADSTPSSSNCGDADPTCAPTTAVPTDAVVVYSDAASTTGFDSCPNWGQSTSCDGEQDIAGNKSLKYSALNYQGLSWELNPLDVSAKGKLHIDMWTPDLTTVKISLISSGPLENAVTKTLTTGAWNSIDIDLAEYTTPDHSQIIQIKLESETPGVLYVDNIYFQGAASGGDSGGGDSGGDSVGAACGDVDPTCAPTTVAPTDAVVVYNDASSTTGFDSCPDWGQATACDDEQNIADNKLLRYSGLNYQGLTWESNPLDVSAKGKLHIDMWTPDLTTVKISLISDGLENAVTKTLTTGAWNSIDIDLAEYTVPDHSQIIQIKLESTTPGVLYVDNIYFWGDAPAGGDSGGGDSSATTGGWDNGYFASDYVKSGEGVSGATAEGGDIGQLIDSAAAATWWWGGVNGSANDPNAAPWFNFNWGWGLDSSSKPAWFGGYVKAPNNGVVSLGDYTSMSISVWGNDELTNTLPDLTIILKGPAVNECAAEVSATQKVERAGVITYELMLSGFAVRTACAYSSASEILAGGLAEIHVQVLGDNIQFVTQGKESNLYPNGLNIGVIRFQ